MREIARLDFYEGIRRLETEESVPDASGQNRSLLILP